MMHPQPLVSDCWAVHKSRPPPRRRCGSCVLRSILSNWLARPKPPCASSCIEPCVPVALRAPCTPGSMSPSSHQPRCHDFCVNDASSELLLRCHLLLRQQVTLPLHKPAFGI